jgi:ketosteroid isomerase-like protein
VVRLKFRTESRKNRGTRWDSCQIVSGAALAANRDFPPFAVQRIHEFRGGNPLRRTTRDTSKGDSDMMRQFATLALVLSMIGGAMSARAANVNEDESKAVRAANDKFYSALNVMFTGELAPMQDVWSHESDVTYMGPGGGISTGWKDVLADWQAQAAKKLGGQVQAKDVHITVGQDMAVVSNLEVGQNFDADGNPEQVEIRATNLFRKEGGQWKMIGHHTDLLPFLKN